MKKGSINYPILNFLMITVIIYLLYAIRGLWMGIISKIVSIGFPFLLAFAVAYALYPIVRNLIKKGLPKWLSITITTILTIGVFILLIILIIPMLYSQLLLFISNISTFIADISSKYELNLGVLQTTLSETSAEIMSSFGSYISSGLIGVVTTSIGIIASLVIMIFVAVYLLIDMDKIRSYIKKTLKPQKRTYNYIKILDNEITNYVEGMGKNMLIQFIEYTTAFFIIGHPNFLILGILAAVTNIIPYIGGFIINILALIIASVISTKLTILTLIVCLICPQLDSYVIGPKVFGKSNNLHPLVSIFAVFAGGILLGFWGILLSLPVAIIIIATYKFYKNDINDKIDSIKK